MAIHPAMSIFDGVTPMNPLPWLQEKTLRALQEATRFVDLANEPDTTEWYAKRLRELATPLVHHLVGVVGLVYAAGQDAVALPEAESIAQGGTFALAKWCKAWDLVDPTEREFALLAEQREAEDIERKAEAPPEEVLSEDSPQALSVRVEVFGSMCARMVQGELSEPGRRMLCWLLFNLTHSPHADVAAVSKRFLPTDIGVTVEETAAAYDELFRAGLIERIEGLPDLREDVIALRLVVSGLNGSKHPLPFREERFGYEGALIGGKRTMGNVFFVDLTSAAGKATGWWATDAKSMDELRSAIQRSIGATRIFIEGVEFRRSEREVHLKVRVRVPMDLEHDDVLRDEVATAAEAWIRQRLRPADEG
jgi:hypothetical protein